MNQPYVDSKLNYTEKMDEKPTVFLVPPPPGKPRDNTVTTRHEMKVHDARQVSDVSLDRQGFDLVRYSTALGDPFDSDHVTSVYYREVEALVRKVTGAHTVQAFDHNVRSAPARERGEESAQTPIRFVHNDYTEASGPQRVRDLADPGQVDRLLAGRFAVINVWRPIRGPVLENPLAVLDARSLSPDDVALTDLVYADRRGEVQSIHYNAGHRWYYYPQMQTDEALLIKCYDSARNGVARFTAHSSFRDPTSQPDAPPRESIEVRTLAFY